MQMNSNLILAGQPVNALAALTQGTQAAGLAGQVGQQGDLLSLYRNQGAGIANGDQNALNALAGLDPMAALGVQESRLGMDATRQGMRINEEQLQMARAAGRRAAESHAASMSAQERQAEAANTRRALTVALPALQQAEQTGDLTNLNQMLRTAGMPPVSSVEEAYVMYMQVEGAVEALETFQGMTQGPEQPGPDLVNVGGVLYDRSAYDGTPGSLVPLTERAPPEAGIQLFGDDGQPLLTVGGPAGQQPMQMQAQPEPVAPSPLLGADNAFGVPSVFQGAANTLADTVGANMPFPEQNEATAEIRLTGDALLQEISSGYERQPPSWLMQSIRENIPQPNRFLQGPQDAANRYRAIRQDLETQMANERAGLTQTRDPRRLAEIHERLRALTNSVSRIDRVLGGMQGGGEISSDDQDLINRYLD